jgi:acyl-CoA synthetase (AMP-forming)/AMP-acid ligase II
MTEFLSVVRRLENAAKQRPDAEAVVHGSRRTRYGDLWRDVRAFAGFLQRQGVARGARVAVLMENSSDYIAAYYGALAVGATAVGLNPAARARELTSTLTHCGASWLVADPRHPDFPALTGEAGTYGVVAVSSEAHAGTILWQEAIRGGLGDPVDAVPSTLAAIIYTSGTTGRPKGVCLTHGNVSANTDGIIEYLQLTATDRVLNVLPFFYSYGASVLHTHLATGATLILENHFVYPQRILDRIGEERVTGFPGVPSTFALLLQSEDLSRAGSLRYMTQAGGAMPSANIERVRTHLPHVAFFVMYGQTEATARLTYLPPNRLLDKLGSVGVPLTGIEIQVQGETGLTLEVGHVGEVCVRGPNVMAGYYNDREATASVLRDGWLHTGDLGYLDDDGFLYLQGRRTDMIKSGAHRISPLDIEEVIAALDEVAEIAVVGVPDSILGEAIKAVVTLRPGATLDAMAVQRHCMQHLPRYKVPKSVQFAERLPRTASGKIMRYQLAGIDS